MDRFPVPRIAGMDILTRRHMLQVGLAGLALRPLVRARPLIAAAACPPAPGEGDFAGRVNVGGGRRLWLE